MARRRQRVDLPRRRPGRRAAVGRPGRPRRRRRAASAIMADRMFGLKVGRRQWMGLGLTAVGLILLAVTLPGPRGRALELLDAGDDRLRGRPVRHRRPAHHGPARRRPGRAPRRHARRRGRHPLRRLRRRHQGAHGHRRRRGRLGLVASPWLLVTIVASVAAFYASARGPAGRRRRPGHRGHRHRGEHRRDRRRDHRLRRPAAGLHASASSCRASPSCS